jgi:intraflagellar transport protein 140
LLVEYNFGQRKFKEAFDIVERMRSRGIPILYFLDRQMVQNIYKSMGVAIELPEDDAEEGVKEDI